MSAVQFIGGPTAVLEYGGLRLLTDPTFGPAGEYLSSSGSRLVKTAGPAVSAEQLGRIDAVLLSHDQHPDNFDDAGRAVTAGAPLTLTTPSGAGRLRGTARPLTRWQRHELQRPDGGRVQVTAVPALHGPEGAESVMGEVTGFVLTGDGLPTVYVSGDNASLAVVRQIAARTGRIDLAMLFAGAARSGAFGNGLLTLDSAQAAQATDILRAPQVIPLHFAQWRHLGEDADALRAAFARAGLTDRLTLLQPGEQAQLSPTEPPIRLTGRRYGSASRERLAQATEPTVDGARAALESFYYALNSRDGDVLRRVWATDPAAQLNNPVGGTLRGDAIGELYDTIFASALRVQVTFGDIAEYADDRHAVFTGRETGSYRDPEGRAVPLAIRTTRYFRYQHGRWWQYHHHGSIDNPDALRAYQHAVTS